MEPTKLDQATELLKEATLKERLWLKHYIATGNKTEAARLAGYDCSTTESFAAVGYQNFIKLHVPELLEEMGLTKKVLIQNVAIGIARPTKKIQKRVKKYLDEEGKVIIETEYEDVPDYDVRHKYLQDALKMQKLLTNDSTTVNVDTDELNFIWGEGSGKQVVNIKTAPQPQVDKG